MNELITQLTEWIPWPWLENLATILIYLGILGALSVIPLLAWAAWAASGTGRRSES